MRRAISKIYGMKFAILIYTDSTLLDAPACAALLEQRAPHPGLAPHAALPADTRLWAALQRASGGTWAGCVYDVDRIVAALEVGLELTKEVK